MKRMIGWLLLAAMLIPGGAMGAQEGPQGVEVLAPGFVYHTLGTEAGDLVDLKRNEVQVAGELFVLEDGYLSIGCEIQGDVIHPYPAGKPLTCLNKDLSTRWALEDEGLAGAWYLDVLELPDALLLGWERSPAEIGQVFSLLMLEKDTGVIRWQAEGKQAKDGELVWIGQCRVGADGNIWVGSAGSLQTGETGGGRLSVLSAADGSVLWEKEYQTHYGVRIIWDLCPLGEGWLIYGQGEGNQIVLYVDAQGEVQGYFTFQTYAAGYDATYLRLVPSSGDKVYLAGWEMEGRIGEVETPYHNRTLCMMPITEDTFGEGNIR